MHLLAVLGSQGIVVKCIATTFFHTVDFEKLCNVQGETTHHIFQEGGSMTNRMTLQHR